MKKGIAILGSTGSIGTQSLKVIEQFPESFRVVSLSCGENLKILREQIHKFSPSFVSIRSREALSSLKAEFPSVDFLYGEEGLTRAVTLPEVDLVVMGIVGFAALKVTLEAVRARKTIALANKEVLVVAGAFLKKEIAKSGAICIPVDSEHNALYQLLRGVDAKHVQTLVLTASGGPLLRRPEIPLEDVTPALATAHPNWKMGPKISVDSATLMNKGLELIEAHFLFDVPQERIEVWVHPQSIVHGAVWLKDNSCLAQMSRPDMRSSIGYAMAYPDRLDSVIPKLSIREFSQLEFFEPDLKRFPALGLARYALTRGASALVALNAGNEVVVNSFLTGELLFPQMGQVLEELISRHKDVFLNSVDDIFALDLEIRETTREIVHKAGE